MLKLNHLGPLLMNKKDSMELSDDYFSYTSDIEPIKIRVFCIDAVKKGDYLTTCPLKGVFMRAANKDVALAYALQGKSKYGIGEINAVLFRE